MKKLLESFKGKSVKQRIAICVVLAAMLTLLFFVIKANFFAIPAKTTEDSVPQFHISIVDILALAGIIIAYIIHKIHEKRKQKRM